MTNAEREGLAAAQLVARANGGDARAFEELVRRYRKRIFALALHLSRSSSTADDITQDVFWKAYRAIDQFEGRSEFFTWIYRMTVNRSLNARRDDARRQSKVLLDDPRLELAVAVDSRGNPGRAAELRENYARLLTALDALPTEMRTSVVLVALQGLSHGEVAIVQKCAEGTVAWHMHEAKKRLVEAMAPTKELRKRPLSQDLRTLLVEHGLPVLAN